MIYSKLERYFLDGWRPYAWIAAIVAFIYIKTIWYGFTYLDDNLLVLNNIAFLKDPSNACSAFFTKVFPGSCQAYYRPMLTLSFMFDAQISGLSLVWYHVTNILLHIIASGALFVFLGRLGYARDLSFLFSLIFAVHPVLSQAVAWIPGRNDTILAIFTLASFILFLNYLKFGRLAGYIGHMLFFMLALFSKETALVIMPICVLYIYTIARDRVGAIKIKALAVGWIIVCVLWGYLRFQAIQGAKDINYYEMVVLVLSYTPAALQFLGKIFFPFNLSVFPVIPDTTFIYGIAALSIMIAAVAATKKRRNNFILFGLAWAVLFLAPSLIRGNTGMLADFLEHRVYVPMIGCIIVLCETDVIKKLSQHKAAMWGLALMATLIFSIITFKHIDNFRNQFTFWGNAVKTSPHSSFAHLSLGIAYQDGSMEDAAVEEYRKCLDLDPRDPGALYGIGNIYLSKGMLDRSEKAFEKVVAVSPFYDNGYLALGGVSYRKGELKKAERAWRCAVLLNPNNANAYRDLAIYYREQKEFDKAADCLKQVQRITSGGK